MKRINTRLIKSKMSYSIPVLAEVVGVHPNTIHGWIRKEGLQCIEGIYPYLLYGQVVIEFLIARQCKNTTKLLPDEFRCCKCQAARKAWEGIVTFHDMTSKTALLRAICASCNGNVVKIVSLKNKAEIEKIFTIHTLLPSALVQSVNTNPNCETKGVHQHG